MKHFKVRGDADLKEFLASALGISKGKAKDLIDTRNVYVNDQRVWIASHRLRRDDRVEIGDSALQERKREPKFRVLHEDDSILAVNKPPMFISDATPDSVEAILRRTLDSPNIKAIHRLDKDTSGVFLLAKNNGVFEQYKTLWRERGVEKRYLAICFNRAQFTETEVRQPVDGRNAVSTIKLLRNGHKFCYLQVDTPTGRKHQIRIHLNQIRHAIVGDKEYGVRVIADPLIKGVSRQMLHCSRIILPSLNAGSREERTTTVAPNPGSRNPTHLVISAPLFDDFRRLGQKLGLIPRDADS